MNEMRTVFAPVRVPAQGVETGLEYTLPSRIAAGLFKRRPRPYEPAHNDTATILAVPADVTDALVREACQVFLNMARGMPARLSWAALVADLDGLGFDVVVDKGAVRPIEGVKS